MDLPAALREALCAAIPGLQASDEPVDRSAVARDVWPRHLIAETLAEPQLPGPALVVWPEHAEQLEALVAFARQRGVALVPYGAGSGVCGAVQPGERSIVVDTKRMTRLRVQREDGIAEVEAGMLGIDLEAALEREGFTLGHFPSSILCSTVGGWLAARSAGQCSSRYGKIEDMVRSADCVLGSGEAVRFTRRLSGPNPLGLLLGSEGTLGLIGSARLQLHPAPRRRAFASFELHDFVQGTEAMRLVMQAGLRPAVMRLYDPIDSLLLSRGKVERRGARRPLRKGGSLSGPWTRRALASPRLANALVGGLERLVSAACLLILIFEGPDDGAGDDLARAERLLRPLAARSLGETPARAWFSHRYAVSYWQSKVFQMGAFNDTLEFAVPWARIGQVYRAVRRAAARHAVVLAHVSHPYPDGCGIYFTLVGTRRGDVLGRYDTLVDEALAAALSQGASLSHHHGVGTSKAQFLDAELGGGVATLRRLRQAWDPDGLMNPATFEPNHVAALPQVREPLPGIDALSGIATFRGDVSLSRIEAEAQLKGLSLGLVGPLPQLSLASFIDAGLPGFPDPFSDPVRTAVCGMVAQGAHAQFRLLPAPRRATGPDLMALCIGAGGRIARVEQASLALVPASLPAPVATAPHVPLVGSEQRAWARVLEVLGLNAPAGG